MMIFILTVHSVSLILIYTVTLITLRSYSNAFWFCSTIETSLSIVALLRKRNNDALSHCYAFYKKILIIM
jgi:hypothetical protein